MKTKVVIDTNVFVSGVFFSGPPSRILRAWQDERIKISVSADILNEYKRVLEELATKFKEINFEYLIELLFIEAELVPSCFFDEPICEDPDDDKFLACAMVSQSKYIISGDKHLLNIGSFLNTQIVSPRHFVDNIL